VPTGQSSNGTARFAVNSPTQPSDDRLPIFRVSWVPWMMQAGQERYMTWVPKGFWGPGGIGFQSG
jgi:hypothetical protein